MPSIIDPNTTYVDDLPGIWAPIQWETTPEEADYHPVMASAAKPSPTPAPNGVSHAIHH